MKALRGFLFAFLLIAALPACTATVETVPEKQPTPPITGPVPAPTSTVPVPIPPGEITATWKAAPGRSFTALASATAGTEGAIAYAEVIDSAGSYTQARIKLQRLDSAGATRGEAVELGAMESGKLSGLTLASDGAQYIACWGDADNSQISCATVSAGQGSASPALSMAGRAPALVYNAGTWALAHSAPNHLAVVKLTSDGFAAGSPAWFDAGEDLSFGMIPLLAPTKLGFVLAGGWDDVRVHQLDFAFAEVAAPVDLGVFSWTFAAIAASETKVAISLATPGGSDVFFLDGVTLLDKQSHNGGGKMGLRAALAAEGTSFGMLSASADDFSPENDGAFRYHTLTPGAVPDVAYLLSEDHRNYLSAPGVLLRLKDEMFFAVTQMNAGEEVVVARTHQP